MNPQKVFNWVIALALILVTTVTFINNSNTHTVVDGLMLVAEGADHINDRLRKVESKLGTGFFMTAEICDEDGNCRDLKERKMKDKVEEFK